MGKPRQSANLVSDNNIFVDISNDRVGIGSTIPRVKLDVNGTVSTSNLIVGSVGSSGTTLYVNGDTRVVGVLSVGQGTVTINGNTNQINVGTAVTIHETNGIRVGGNALHSTGLTLNNLNVTGVVTSIGGITLGIQSAGTNVTSGVVTALNFVGTGNSISYNAGTKTVNISIAGGGGGGSSATRPTQFSSIFVSNDSGFSGQVAYSAMARTAGGTKGNTFFIVRAEGSSSPTTTRYRVYPITVNRTTGVITSGTPVNAWTNSSAASNYSTTHFIGPDGTGAIFAGGHNAIPGTSTYTFSYFKFIVNANGTLSDTAQVNTNADHVTNGTYMTLPTAINSGRIPSVGYDANASSRAHYRLSTTNGSTITVGNIVSLGSDTSTVYPVQMYSQPGVYQSGTQAIGFINYRVNSSTYYIKAFSASGLNADYQVNSFDSQMYGFQMANGEVILYCLGLGKVFRFASYNSVTDISSTALSNFVPVSISGNYIYPNFCTGTNEFVFSLSSVAPFAFNSPLIKATLSNSTGFTITEITSPDAITSIGYNSDYTSLFPLYANESDASPDKLLLFASNSNYFKAKVISMPTFTTLT